MGNNTMRESHNERYFINYTWIFLGIILAYAVIADVLINFNSVNLSKDMLLIALFAAINQIKTYLLDAGIHKFDYFYLRSRLIEIFLVCFGFFFLHLNVWISSFIIGSIIFVTVLEGRKKALHVLLGAYLISILLFLMSGSEKIESGRSLLTFVFILATSFAACIAVSKLSTDLFNVSQNNEDEIEALKSDNEEAGKMIVALDEKSEKYKQKIATMESESADLKVILEKYYELYNISSVINSIFDIGGLLRFINETIIEIVEADYSTILLFESKRGSLEVENTNISDEENLKRLEKCINTDIVFDIIENGSLFVVNFVDNDDYEFIRGRDVKSFACMPVSTSKKKYGVILIESLEFNKFDEQIQKLITLIGYQVSSSMENLELYKKMKELATTDALTLVQNRLYFQERLSKELKIAHENDFPLSLVIFDIDHFKKFNDNYSHLVGDKVLKVITSVAKNSIRRSDMIARYGGEEFVILFTNMDIEHAQETCEMLRKKIENTKVKVRDQELSITVSFGVANYPLNAFSEENLVKAADRALYEAKGAGRNRVAVSNEKLI